MVGVTVSIRVKDRFWLRVMTRSRIRVGKFCDCVIFLCHHWIFQYSCK